MPKPRVLAPRQQVLYRPLGEDDWTRAWLPTVLGGLGLRSAETLKDIAFAVTEKNTEPQTQRIEANKTCRVWRKDERKKRKLQLITDVVMEGGNGRLSPIGNNCSQQCRVLVFQ